MLFGAMLGAAALAMLSGDQLYDYRDTVRADAVERGELPEADVIVVLTGGRARIRMASELWFRFWMSSAKRKTAPVFLVSGMGETADWTTLAQHVRPEVLDVLPPEQTILEKKSTNTRENAEVFVEYLRMYAQRGRPWRTLVLVTSNYHMKRAAHLFRKELNRNGFNYVHIETYSVAQEPMMPETWRHSFLGLEVTLVEFFKWVFTRALA